MPICLCRASAISLSLTSSMRLTIVDTGWPVVLVIRVEVAGGIRPAVVAGSARRGP